jgi:hypothetical protein
MLGLESRRESKNRILENKVGIGGIEADGEADYQHEYDLARVNMECFSFTLLIKATAVGLVKYGKHMVMCYTHHIIRMKHIFISTMY